jgi:hypothetical protein
MDPDNAFSAICRVASDIERGTRRDTRFTQQA